MKHRRPHRLASQILACAFVLGVGCILIVAGWRVCGRFGERCEEVGQFFPRYDTATKRIDLVMYDLNKNGVIDTWAYRNTDGSERFDVDRNEDGVIDRILLLDGHSTVRMQPG